MKSFACLASVIFLESTRISYHLDIYFLYLWRLFLSLKYFTEPRTSDGCVFFLREQMCVSSTFDITNNLHGLQSLISDKKSCIQMQGTVWSWNWEFRQNMSKYFCGLSYHWNLRLYAILLGVQTDATNAVCPDVSDATNSSLMMFDSSSLRVFE